MNKESKGWRISHLMTLMVFFTFALCLLLVLLTGAKVYRSTVAQGQAQFDTRTAAQYLSTRVRQSDCREQVAVEDFGGVDALVFREEIGGREYKTLVYCYDGSLRELFCTESAPFSPADGEILFPLQALSLEEKKGVLFARLTLPSGETLDWTIRLRSAQEVLP